MVFPRSGISSGNPADDAKLVDILPKWLSCATKLEIRQATLEKPWDNIQITYKAIRSLCRHKFFVLSSQ